MKSKAIDIHIANMLRLVILECRVLASENDSSAIYALTDFTDDFSDYFLAPSKEDKLKIATSIAERVERCDIDRIRSLRVFPRLKAIALELSAALHNTN